MSNYYTPAISTGKIQIDGNLYFGVDASGNVVDASGITASLRAVEINATTVIASTINATNLEYSSLDLSGNLTVGGNLIVEGTTSIGSISFNNLDLSGNLAVSGNTTLNTAYIDYLEVGTLVLDTSDNVFNNLDVSGNVNVGDTVFSTNVVSENINSNIYSNNAGFSVDASANVNVPGTITSVVIDNSLNINSKTFSNDAGFEVDASANVIVPGSLTTDSGFTVDLAGNVVVPGSLTTDAGFEVDASANVVVPGSLTTDSGFTVDLAGNVVVPGSLITDAGFEVDASGNLSVLGTTSVQSLNVDGETSLNANVNITQNLAVEGGQYIDGGLYVNNGLTVGDSSNGDGVTMESSGSVISLFSQDASMNVLPATLKVDYLDIAVATVDSLTGGSIDLDSGFTVDLSGNVILPGSLTTDAGFTVDLAGNVVVPGSLTTDSGFTVDLAGNVVVPGSLITDAGFEVDASGNLSVIGTTTFQSLSVNGQTSLNANVNITQNLAVQGGQYVAGGLYVNTGLTVGDSSNGRGVIMDSSGSVISLFAKDASGNVLPATLKVDYLDIAVATVDSLTGGSIDLDSGFTVDLSGNVILPGSLITDAGFEVDASGNLSVVGTTTFQSLSVDGETSLNQNVNITENLAVQGGQYVAGGLYVNTGLTVGDSSNGYGVTMDSSGSVVNFFSKDESGNVLPATINVEYLTVPSGMIDSLTSNIITSNTITNVAGFEVDASGNLTVAGTTSVQSLEVNGQSSFEQNLNIVQNIAVEGGQYIDGSLYVNNGVTIGDSYDGDGVTMESSGTSLSVFSKDSSLNILPVILSTGSVLVNNSYTLDTFTDSSGDFVSLNTSNATIPTLGTNVPNYQMVISINGEKYSLNLFKVV
jgi:cytoskeletal protein CcmA (bactofilin family)